MFQLFRRCTDVRICGGNFRVVLYERLQKQYDVVLMKAENSRYCADARQKLHDDAERI